MSEKIKHCSVQDARHAVYLDPKNQFLDVREKEEFDKIRIPNTIWIPLSKFEIEYVKLDKNSPVYIMCKIGQRSQMAAEFLASNGFSSLYVVEGGLKAWIEAAYAFVGDKNAI